MDFRPTDAEDRNGAKEELCLHDGSVTGPGRARDTLTTVGRAVTMVILGGFWLGSRPVRVPIVARFIVFYQRSAWQMLVIPSSYLRHTLAIRR